MANRSKSGNSKSQDILEILLKWNNEEYYGFKTRESLQSLLNYYWEHRYEIDEDDFDENLLNSLLDKNGVEFKPNTLSKYKIDLYEAILEYEVSLYNSRMSWHTETENLIIKSHALIDRKLYKQAKPLVDRLKHLVKNKQANNESKTKYSITGRFAG